MTKNKAAKKKSSQGHERRMRLIRRLPAPTPVRKAKAMTNAMVKLQQEIIECDDPEMRRDLLPLVTSCLDDQIKIAELQSRTLANSMAILEILTSKNAKVDDNVLQRLRSAAGIELVYCFDESAEIPIDHRDGQVNVHKDPSARS
jgi:hypothetical protein